MLLLGLDTATLTLSAALVERPADGGPDRLLERRIVEPPTAHSSVLPGLLEEMLAARGAGLDALAGVVVGIGPGSFTGLRIGLATVKGLCYAARVPLVGASSLAAMARAAADALPEGELLVPCLDARKGEVYCGFFRVEQGRLRTEEPEAALSPEALDARLQGRPARVFGIGREAYPALAARPDPGTSVRTPDAGALVRLVEAIPAWSAQAVFALEPHYVRPSDVEWTLREKKKRESTQ